MRVLLSASAKADTQALRRDLNGLGAEVVPTTEIGVGARLAPALREDDRLLAVLESAPAGNPAILVEIGIAIGRGLPVLAFIPQESALPAILDDTFVLRGNPENFSERLLALKLFLRAMPTPLPSYEATNIPRSPSSIDTFRSALRELESGSQREIEYLRLVADILRQSGAQVEEQKALPTGMRPDIAFSIPGKEDQLGTVIVELKRHTRHGSLQEAASQLQRFVLDQGGGLGLLLYTGPERSLQTWPMIVALSVERFVTGLGEHGLADVLIRARNEAIHDL